MKRQLVCGLHVHVGMESFDDCLRTLAAITPWLPAVLALSLNSPYVAGVETGGLSARAGRLLELPRGGPPAAMAHGGGVAGASRRPARTTHAAGGTRGRIRGSGRSRCGSPTSRRCRSIGAAALVRRSVARRSARTLGGGRAGRGGSATSGARRAGSARARHLGARRGVAQAAGGVPSARDRSPRRARGGRGRARGANRGMTQLRSVLYPLRLVWARLRSWSGPVVLVVLGIAAGASVVVGGRAGAVVAQDRAVAQAVERIPDGSRSVRAVWFGVPARATSAARCSSAVPAPRSARGRRRRARARPLPREHDRGHVRRARRRRGARAGDAPLWTPAAECRPSGARFFACVAQAGGCRSRQG